MDRLGGHHNIIIGYDHNSSSINYIIGYSRNFVILQESKILNNHKIQLVSLLYVLHDLTLG